MTLHKLHFYLHGFSTHRSEKTYQQLRRSSEIIFFIKFVVNCCLFGRNYKDKIMYTFYHYFKIERLVKYLKKSTTIFLSQSIKINEHWSTCYLVNFLLKIALNIYFTIIDLIENVKIIFYHYFKIEQIVVHFFMQVLKLY